MMTQSPLPQGALPQGYVAQQYVAPGQVGGMPQAVTPEEYNVAYNAMPNASAQNVVMQNAAAQNALVQSLNPSNAMMINPAYSQVVPGLSMTGTQAPGYPPIGYAPSGYALGYAQQTGPPPLTGPLGPGQQQSSLAATAGTQTRAANTSVDEDEEALASPRHVAAMPYPRHFPVPTRPVYQRNMGMAPGYAAVKPSAVLSNLLQPSAAQGMSPQNQISQAAAYQEQQMMLERQRQALLMQQNASITQMASRQSASRQSAPRPLGKTAPTPLQRAPDIEVAEEEAIVAPLPPSSKILLANHQTSILQPAPPRVSQVAHVSPESSAKKSR
jgi:hypothetical protein